MLLSKKSLFVPYFEPFCCFFPRPGKKNKSASFFLNIVKADIKILFRRICGLESEHCHKSFRMEMFSFVLSQHLKPQTFFFVEKTIFYTSDSIISCTFRCNLFSFELCKLLYKRVHILSPDPLVNLFLMTSQSFFFLPKSQILYQNGKK